MLFISCMLILIATLTGVVAMCLVISAGRADRMMEEEAKKESENKDEN